MTVRSDVSSLLELVGDGSCRHTIRDCLDREAVDMPFKIGEQAETVAAY